MNILRPWTDKRNGMPITLGVCPLCGRSLTKSAANKTGARCRFDGAQFDRDGRFIYDASTKPNGRAAAPATESKVITICVSGGVVQSVDGVPRGVTVRIEDYDVDGCDESKLETGSDGGLCSVGSYEGK